MAVNKLGRSPFITVWFYVIIGAIITWQEYFTPITSSDYQNLVLLRVLILGSIIPVAYVLRKNPFLVWANSFVCMNFLLYSMVGHYYRPLYYACFIQTVFAFSVLFFTSRKLYFVLITLKSLGFVGFYLWSYDHIKYAHGAETKLDFIATILVAWALGLLIHHLFASERGLKEAARDRFALLGRHAVSIVHDVKGSIGIPYLYLQEAKKAIQAEDYGLVKDYLQSMETSLSRTERTILDLNSLSRIAEGSDSQFSVKESIENVFEMLSKRLQDVEVKIEGDFEVIGDRGAFCSIFLNLIVNSLESFRRSQTSKPQIGISIKAAPRTISIQDNGGGFSEKALSALKDGRFLSAADSSSGLGLLLVQESLRLFKGKISFQNKIDGALVEIKFKA